MRQGNVLYFYKMMSGDLKKKFYIVIFFFSSLGVRKHLPPRTFLV